ncbi:unnamed protein product, partial [Musa hybrid cultivar]
RFLLNLFVFHSHGNQDSTHYKIRVVPPHHILPCSSPDPVAKLFSLPCCRWIRGVENGLDVPHGMRPAVVVGSRSKDDEQEQDDMKTQQLGTRTNGRRKPSSRNL